MAFTSWIYLIHSKKRRHTTKLIDNRALTIFFCVYCRFISFIYWCIDNEHDRNNCCYSICEIISKPHAMQLKSKKVAVKGAMTKPLKFMLQTFWFFTIQFKMKWSFSAIIKSFYQVLQDLWIFFLLQIFDIFLLITFARCVRRRISNKIIILQYLHNNYDTNSQVFFVALFLTFFRYIFDKILCYLEVVFNWIRVNLLTFVAD